MAFVELTFSFEKQKSSSFSLEEERCIYIIYTAFYSYLITVIRYVPVLLLGPGFGFLFEKQGLGNGALIHDSILGTASLCFEKFLLLAELEQVKPTPELSQGQGPACNPEVLLFILEALFHS